MKKTLQLSMVFITTALFAQAPTNGLIAYYGFQNNYTSQNNTFAFTNATTTVAAVPFVVGKYGQGVSFSSNNQYLVNNTLNADISNNSEITIAFWQKTINVADQFKTTFELFGSLYFRNSNLLNRVGLSNDGTNFLEGNVENNTQNNYGVWKHYAISSRIVNGTRVLQFFINGVPDNGVSFPSLHKFTAIATIGAGTDANGTLMSSKRFSGVVDEFFIYNRGLSNQEIMGVMNDNSLSSENFQSSDLQFSISPNPANNLLSIDMANEIQSVEIYSLQGQKVFSGNNKTVDIANLSSGMYMVRVQDIDGGVATQKLVKE